MENKLIIFVVVLIFVLLLFDITLLGVGLISNGGCEEHQLLNNDIVSFSILDQQLINNSAGGVVS